MFRHTSKERSVGILVTGISMINVPIVFADSRILKHDTKQNANCDTVGAGSPVSDSNPSTGTLLIRKSCVISGGGSCPGNHSFNAQVTGNNAQTTSFSISNVGGQSVTLGGGSFTVRDAAAFGFTPSFSGDCMQSSSNSQEATGTSAAGQHLTCTITNTAVPATGTLTVNKICVESSNPGDCERTGTGQFEIRITGNNPNPPGIELRGGAARTLHWVQALSQ